MNKANYYLVVWLYERREPDEEKRKIGLDKLDADHNGSVTLVEWLAYLTIGDPFSDIEFFNGHLRKDFIKIDTDNSGFLEKEELVMVMNSTLEKWARTNLGVEYMKAHRKDLNAFMKRITEKILHRMKLDKIDWDSFEEFWNESKEEMAKLKDFTMSTQVKRNTETLMRTLTGDSVV